MQVGFMCEWWDYSRGFSVKGARHKKNLNITRNFRGLNEKQRVIFLEFMAYRSSGVVSNRQRFGPLGAWMRLGIGRGGRGECVGVLTKARG
jgi:hypothetical protein